MSSCLIYDASLVLSSWRIDGKDARACGVDGDGSGCGHRYAEGKTSFNESASSMTTRQVDSAVLFGLWCPDQLLFGKSNQYPARDEGIGPETK